MLKKLSDELTTWVSGSRPLTQPDGQIFPPLDTSRFLRQLDIEARAAQDGANKIPRTDSTISSNVEIEIKSKIESVHADYINAYHDHFSQYQERYSDCTKLWRMELVENEERGLVDDVIAEANNRSGPLYGKREKLLGTAEQLQRFREENNLLNRLPSFENSYKLLFIVLISLLVEFLTSFYLMQEASESVLTVAVLILMFCVLNTVFPITVFSQLAKLAYSVDSFKKSMGIFFLTAITGFGVFLNLMIGHFRLVTMEFSARTATTISSGQIQQLTAEIAQQQQLAADAWRSFIENGIFIEDTWAWMLIPLNLIIYFYSLYEGIIKDDAYPGYGKAARAFENTHDEYNDEIEFAQEELAELRDDAIDAIEDLKSKLYTTFKTAPTLIANADNLFEKYRQRASSLPDLHTQLVMRYRESNIAARNDNPPPAYFDRPPEYNLVLVEKGKIQKIEPNSRELVNRLDSFAQKVNAEFEAIQAKIKSSDEVLGENYPLRVR